jgi:hypothetical protein
MHQDRTDLVAMTLIIVWEGPVCVDPIPRVTDQESIKVTWGRSGQKKEGVFRVFFSSLTRFLNRRVPPVKFFTRVLVLFVLSVGMFAVAGCGVDNEEEGKKLAKEAGDPGPPNPKGIPTTKQAPATSQEDRFKNSQQTQKEVGYPGAKK